jgi:ribosome-associated translation inhibitor RaiA
LLRVRIRKATDVSAGTACEACRMAVELQDVVVSTRGVITETAAEYASGKVRRAARLAPAPVLHARVELHQHLNPSIEQPSVATVNLDVNGRPVRAQAAASSMTEAIDLLEARLRQRLEVLSSRLKARQRRGVSSDSGEWRHGDHAGDRQWLQPRPVADAQIVARASYDDEPLAIEEAVYELDLLDYEFLLFVDADTRVDSLLYHPVEGGFARVVRAWAIDSDLREQGDLPARDAGPAPQLSRTDARSRLEADGERFVFFRDADNGRGSVLYHRVDGQLGLLTPGA